MTPEKETRLGKLKKILWATATAFQAAIFWVGVATSAEAFQSVDSIPAMVLSIIAMAMCVFLVWAIWFFAKEWEQSIKQMIEAE